MLNVKFSFHKTNQRDINMIVPTTRAVSVPLSIPLYHRFKKILEV